MINLGSLGEFLIIVIAIIVFIRPSKLPELLYDIGRMRQKIRVLFNSFTSEIDKYLEPGELEEYKNQINSKFTDSKVENKTE